MIKYQQTNVGKYNMFDVELGELKTTISCDSDNADKLIEIFNELAHNQALMVEENKALQKQIKSSVILDEASKNVLTLMRSQIDDLLERPAASNAVSIIEQKGGIEKLKQLNEAGVLQKEIAEAWGISSARVSMYISEHGESWLEWNKQHQS